MDDYLLDEEESRHFSILDHNFDQSSQLRANHVQSLASEVDENGPAPKQRKITQCSRCKQAGHTSRNRNCPLNPMESRTTSSSTSVSGEHRIRSNQGTFIATDGNDIEEEDNCSETDGVIDENDEQAKDDELDDENDEVASNSTPFLYLSSDITKVGMIKGDIDQSRICPAS